MSLCIKLIGQGAARMVVGLGAWLAAGFCQVMGKGWAWAMLGVLQTAASPGEEGGCVGSFSVVVLLCNLDTSLQPKSLRYNIKK